MSDVRYQISEHAHKEAERRGIPLNILQTVLEKPEQIVGTHSNRRAFQSRLEIDDKVYLVRAIVENSDPPIVVTVYRTSKIEKYWREKS